jgi:hypothetical protein
MAVHNRTLSLTMCVYRGLSAYWDGESFGADEDLQGRYYSNKPSSYFLGISTILRAIPCLAQFVGDATRITAQGIQTNSATTLRKLIAYLNGLGPSRATIVADAFLASAVAADGVRPSRRSSPSLPRSAATSKKKRSEKSREVRKNPAKNKKTTK